MVFAAACYMVALLVFWRNHLQTCCLDITMMRLSVHISQINIYSTADPVEHCGNFMDNNFIPIVCYLFSLRIYYYQIWSGQYQLFNGHAYDPSSCRIATELYHAWPLSFNSVWVFLFFFIFADEFTSWGGFFSGHPMLTMCPLFQLLLLNYIHWLAWQCDLNSKFEFQIYEFEILSSYMWAINNVWTIEMRKYN